MQKDDLKKKDIPIDTVLRSYDLGKYDYKVQPQDILMVRFESLTEQEFDFLGSRTAQGIGASPALASLVGEMVDDNGEIEYPVIGKVKVAGLNIFEIQDKLRDLTMPFLESPKISVRIMNFRVTVLGEVFREGQVVMNNNRVSMLEAIGLTGGFGEFADRSKVKVLRQVGDKLTVQYINVLDENFANSPYFYVHQNDVLVVPPLNQKPFRRYFGANLALVVSTVSVLLFTLNILK